MGTRALLENGRRLLCADGKRWKDCHDPCLYGVLIANEASTGTVRVDTDALVTAAEPGLTGHDTLVSGATGTYSATTDGTWVVSCTGTDQATTILFDTTAGNTTICVNGTTVSSTVLELTLSAGDDSLTITVTCGACP